MFRCSRRTTFLESSISILLGMYVCTSVQTNINILWFVRFISGSLANDIHFQAILLEGLSRWKQAWTLLAVQHQDPNVKTFDLDVACKVGYHCTFSDIYLLS